MMMVCSGAVPERCATVALVGRPNVGKSSILNSILGCDLSIVTRKAQTTRKSIKGVRNIVTESMRAQLIFVDTPGIFNVANGNNLEKFIVSNAWAAIKCCDFIGFVFSATDVIDSEQVALVRSVFAKCNLSNGNEKYGSHGVYKEAECAAPHDVKKLFAIVNKVDVYSSCSIHQHAKVLEKTSEISSIGHFESVFAVSASSGMGVNNVVEYVSHNAPLRKWVFHEDLYTDESERSLAEEITRESLYVNLSDELPYSTKVETDIWKESKYGSVKIYQSIYVLKNSQKNIVLGKSGAMIKKIGQDARHKIGERLGRRIHLFLFVKVREAWIKDLKARDG